jgi:hypothetical protein
VFGVTGGGGATGVSGVEGGEAGVTGGGLTGGGTLGGGEGVTGGTGAGASGDGVEGDAGDGVEGDVGGNDGEDICVASLCYLFFFQKKIFSVSLSLSRLANRATPCLCVSLTLKNSFLVRCCLSLSSILSPPPSF